MRAQRSAWPFSKCGRQNSRRSRLAVRASVAATGQSAEHGLALQVEGLRVSYGPKVAVDGVSLDINEGEIFGLLGPNGAGQTSTLSAIEGLVRPDAGSIRIGDVDARANPNAAKARMGVQLQSTSFQSDLTIREIVRLEWGLYGVPLTRAGIDERLADVPLGGGGAQPLGRV